MICWPAKGDFGMVNPDDLLDLGGQFMAQDCKEQMPVHSTETCLTEAYYLPSRFVNQVVVPACIEKDQEDSLVELQKVSVATAARQRFSALSIITNTSVRIN